jgi:hypothetical protein
MVDSAAPPVRVSGVVWADERLGNETVLVVAIVVGLVMTASIAVAQVSDGGGMYACADAKDGDLRLVDTADDCTKKEVAVSWNQEGPQGAPGIDGVDGIDGISCAVVEEPTGTFRMACPGSSPVTWSGAEHGPIVMTTSGNSWLAHGQSAAATPYHRWGTETTFFVPVRMVISLTGPSSVNGVEYGLESFDLCVITDSNYVSSVSVTGIDSFGPDVDDEQYLNLFHETFASPGLTTGCHTFAVNAPVGQGAGLMVEITDIGDGSPVTLASVRSVWTPEAAQG